MVRNYFMTRSRWFNDVLLVIREWRARRLWGEPVVRGPDMASAELTVLVGDLAVAGRALELATSLEEKASVQALGFQFGGSVGSEQVTELAGCSFPEFHGILASALLKISGRKLVAADPGLLGLGLGLISNYHFGTPLYIAGIKSAASKSGDDYQDPRSPAWEKLLARWVEQVPGLDEAGGENGVMPASREFAEWFAEFYRGSRK